MSGEAAARGIYTLAHGLAVPLLLARLGWRARRDRGYAEGWGERLGFGAAADRAAPPALWVHAVSVGEVQAAVPVVERLLALRPDARLVVSTVTPTGRRRATQALADRAHYRFLPYDLPGCVDRFLDRVRPGIAVVMETEIWPNLFRACARRGVPIVLANARLSERSARRYRPVRPLVGAALGRVSLVAAQTAADRERLVRLGAPAARAHVVGNVKLDVRAAPSAGEHAQVLRRAWGAQRPVWIAASTHPGEEEAALDAHRALRARLPDALLVLVPRHPERRAAVAALARRRGLSVALRTQAPEPPPDADVYLGDTLGELAVLYAAADVAFVGGSLVPVGGHNLLEPAALGVPVLCGPHRHNFAAVSAGLLEAGAARLVEDAAALAAALAELLPEPNLRFRMGEQGRAFVERNRGAVERLVGLLEPLLPA